MVADRASSRIRPGSRGVKRACGFRGNSGPVNYRGLEAGIQTNALGCDLIHRIANNGSKVLESPYVSPIAEGIAPN